MLLGLFDHGWEKHYKKAMKAAKKAEAIHDLEDPSKDIAAWKEALQACTKYIDDRANVRGRLFDEKTLLRTEFIIRQWKILRVTEQQAQYHFTPEIGLTRF